MTFIVGRKVVVKRAAGGCFNAGARPGTWAEV
jgi:hypothetical protein